MLTDTIEETDVNTEKAPDAADKLKLATQEVLEYKAALRIAEKMLEIDSVLLSEH